MRPDNKALVKRVFDELLNEGRLEVVDELFASGYVGHDPADQLLRVSGGPEGVKGFVSAMRSASSDLRFHIQELIAEADKVMAMWTASGTHTGDFLGLPPTGRRVELQGVILYRLRAGVIVEGWHGWDSLSLLRQLGAAPA